MNASAIIKSAIPDAGDALVEHVLWARTPFPVGKISARQLYKAAARFRRALDNGICLCDLCDRIAAPNKPLCCQCQTVITNLTETL